MTLSLINKLDEVYQANNLNIRTVQPRKIEPNSVIIILYDVRMPHVIHCVRHLRVKTPCVVKSQTKRSSVWSDHNHWLEEWPFH